MIVNKINQKNLAEQAKIEIHSYINQMDLQKSNKLPREEILAEMIGVSRITIRQSLNDLAAEGIIFRRQGKGTFVNVDSLNIKVTFNPTMDFSQMIRNSGYSPSVKLLNISKVPYDETISKQLQLPAEEQLVLAEKLFLADSQICAFCRDYFGLSLIGGEKSFAEFSNYEDSIFEYIYSLSGCKVEWDKVEMDTILSTDIPNLGNYVNMKEFGLKPMFLVKGVNYSSEDRPLLLANEYIDTSIIKFRMIRQKNIKY